MIIFSPERLGCLLDYGVKFAHVSTRMSEGRMLDINYVLQTDSLIEPFHVIV
jgi:hypothetical protein